jgi:hypothetical protein
MSNQPMPRTIDPTCYIASLLITIQVKQKNCGGYYEHRHNPPIFFPSAQSTSEFWSMAQW